MRYGGRNIYGDAITTLRKFRHEIHLCINDSDHSADYEAAEYEVAKRLLLPDNGY